MTARKDERFYYTQHTNKTRFNGFYILLKAVLMALLLTTKTIK